MDLLLVLSCVICTFVSLCETVANPAETVRLESTQHNQIFTFNVPTSKITIKTWIDLKTGIYPQTSSINHLLKIGEPVSILIYLHDPSRKYDIEANNCWASDNKNYDLSQNKVHLTTNSNINTTKRINSWLKDSSYAAFNQTILIYTNFTSFKFPDTNAVYLTCKIKLCYEDCTKPSLGRRQAKIGKEFLEARSIIIINVTKELFPDDDINIKKHIQTQELRADDFLVKQQVEQSNCSLDDNNAKCLSTNIPNCFTGSQDPRCTSEVQSDCSSQPGCNILLRKLEQSRRLICRFGSNRPWCQSSTTYAPSYSTPPLITNYKPKPTSVNPAYPTKPPYTRTTYLSPSPCYPGSVNSLCHSETVTTTSKSTSKLTTTSKHTKPPYCYPGSTNPQCETNKPTVASTKTSTTPKTTVTTTKTTTTATICDHNSIYDVTECNNGDLITQPSKPYFPSTTKTLELTTSPVYSKPPYCYPGSQDIRCRTKSSTILTTSTKPPCYPGSTYYHCVMEEKTEESTKITKVTPGYSKPVYCYPGSQDIRCRTKPSTLLTISTKPPCNPGSTYYHCVMEEKTEESTKITKVTPGYSKPVYCYPGSTNPSCHTEMPIISTTTKQSTIEYTTTEPCGYGSTDPNCYTIISTQESKRPSKSTTKTPYCYPGSSHADCITQIPNNPPSLYPINTSPVICYPGSSKPECDSETITEPITKPTPIYCYLGSLDPHCRTDSSEPPSKPTKPQCHPGSPRPECDEETYTEPTSQEAPPYCYFGASDPRCHTKLPKLTTPQCYPGSPRPECDVEAYTELTSQKPPAYCYFDSSDPRCRTKVSEISPKPTKPQCFPGSTRADCEKELYTKITTHKTPSPCYFDSSDPRCQTQIKPTKQNCYPGSPRPECDEEAYTESTTKQTPPYCYFNPSNPRCRTDSSGSSPKPTILYCSPGSVLPECQNGYTETTTKHIPRHCYLNPSDPRCPTKNPDPTSAKPNCFPGSSKPGCSSTKPTSYLEISVTENTTPYNNNCYPGSPNIFCKLIKTLL